MNPQALAHRMIGICAHRGSAGVAFQALDHQLVREAVDDLVRTGIPVVAAVLGDIEGNIKRLAYIGIDNRAAGRTAASWMAAASAGGGQAAWPWDITTTLSPTTKYARSACRSTVISTETTPPCRSSRR